MNWFTGCVVYVLIWWTTLFAVLPIGTQPVQQADAHSGWRGAPARPQLLRKLLITTVAATVIWFGVYLLVESPWLSFRHGIFAAPED